MSEYSDRRFEILIDGNVFIAQTGGRQFKILFEILLDFGGFTSFCDISFFNLNTSTAAVAFERGKIITIKAGYKNTIDTIFSGVIKNGFRERRGPDVINRVLARGGKLADERAILSQSFGKNAKVIDLVRACATALEYPLVIREEDFADLTPYVKGYLINGDPQTYLDKLALAHNFSYNVENERLIVTANDSFRLGDVHKISQFTGMEGIPEINEVGADVTIRLNPKIKIGGRFDLESEFSTFNFSNLFFRDVPESAGQGVYRIFRVAHSGDSWGDTWSTKINGLR